MQLPRLCIALCLVGALPAWAQKTEVTVSKGKVKAQVPAGTVLVESGQKALLQADRKPVVGVDDPLVRELVELDKLVEAEKAALQAEGARVDYANGSIGSIEADGSYRGAALAPIQNHDKEPSRRIRIGPTMRQTSAAYYLATGKVIPVDIEKAGPDTDYHYLNFEEAIPPGGSVRVIMLGSLAPSPELLWQDGKKWCSIQGNGSAYSLAYRRIVLPPSAVLVDSSLAPMEAGTVGGRLMLTFRKYTGKDGDDGNWAIAFLWPDRDNSSVSDLPEYRGLGDPRQQTLRQEYRQAMARIRGGEIYNDQTNPLRAVLTWNCAVVRQDKNLLDQASDPGTGTFSSYIQKLTKNDCEQLSRQFVDHTELLSIPPWPDAPQEGYIHPVYMAWPGSLIRAETLAVVYSKGKWVRFGNMGNPWKTDLSGFARMLKSAP